MVLCHKHKAIDGRLGLVKEIKKSGVFYNSKKLYDNQLIPWIEQQLSRKGSSITPKASYMIKESIGDNLTRISNELDKLLINLKKGGEITEETVEKYIGLSKEYNVFELTDALGKKDVLRSNKIISHFGKNESVYPLQLIIPSIYRYFSQLMLIHALKGETDRKLASEIGIHPYFLNDIKAAARNYTVKKIARIISSLRKADNHSKGIGAVRISNGEILKELIFDILH